MQLTTGNTHITCHTSCRSNPFSTPTFQPPAFSPYSWFFQVD